MNELPTKLQTIIEEFSLLEGREKLEYLLELADRLPPLPEWLLARRDSMDMVHECMTAVFIYAETAADGGVRFYIDVPPEGPTVRGYATILQEGLSGETAATIAAVPTEFYLQMGLQQVLSGQRLNGIGAILEHMKRLAAEAQPASQRA
ncbi:MAG: SufE family protein [Candidatus Promineofilum sp.]|jgi:cysteine desulfuration protein SufE|nr:SufE family protein [Promineifilum sp.]